MENVISFELGSEPKMKPSKISHLASGDAKNVHKPINIFIICFRHNFTGSFVKTYCELHSALTMLIITRWQVYYTDLIIGYAVPVRLGLVTLMAGAKEHLGAPFKNNLQSYSIIYLYNFTTN